MKKYAELSKEELLEIKKELSAEYEKEKALKLNLNMARGKPSSEQLDLTKKMLEKGLISVDEFNKIMAKNQESFSPFFARI